MMAKRKKRFFRRGPMIVLGVLLAAALAAGAWYASQTPRTAWSPRPPGQIQTLPEVTSSAKAIRNVLLISIDTCRADHLGCYGYTRQTSPNIDALAAEGIVYNHAVSTVPMTLPAHCSMMTGKIPPQHRVRTNTGYQLDRSHLTLAQTLQDHGYATGAIIGAYVLGAQFGLDSGFQTYDDEMEIKEDINRFRNERRADEVTQRAMQWLDKHGKEKFFLFVHYYDPHDPYVYYGDFNFTSPFGTKRLVDRYDSEIAFTDFWVGRLLDKLRQMGLYDTTLIILTSDHGESLGERGENGHSFFIYHNTMHVPFILKAPGLSGGFRIYETVGIVDVFPTVCGWLGIDPPAGIRGQDLSAPLRAKPVGAAERHFYCESLTPTTYNAASLVGLVNRRFKYIQTTRPELYDLYKDVEETENLIDEDRDEAAELKQHLEKITGSVSEPSDGEANLDAEALQRLQALGYVGGKVSESIHSDPDLDDPKDLLTFHESYGTLSKMIIAKHYAEAKQLTRELIEQRPKYYGLIMVSLAQILAVHPSPEQRDPETALFIAQHAADVSDYQEAGVLDVLAMALASAGRFERAAMTAEMAIKLAYLGNAKDYAEEIATRLALYKQNKPYQDQRLLEKP